eukprot:511335_1
MSQFFSIIICCILFQRSQSYSCNAQFDLKTKRTSNPNIISAYNDVLGPIINLTYDDTALVLSVEKLYPTLLRHPGGTVADYWSFKNASFVTPCNTSHYNFCKWQERVSKLPLQTFSPANFSNNIGKLFNHNIIYDLNVFSLYNEQMVNELNILYKEIGVNNMKYLELGNEFYLNSFKWQFPNSSVYMQKVLPVISTARTLFPTAKIGAVSQISLASNTNNIKWNEDLKPYIKYIDAVTIHDYSLNTNRISKDNPNYLKNWNEERTYISSYGMSVIPQYVEYINKTFGDNITIWMTEYDVNLGDVAFGKNTSFMWSSLHAMYSFGYIIASICEKSGKMDMMLHTMWSEQDGTNWFVPQATNYNPALANDDSNARFDIIAQTRAQLSWISTVKNDQQFCLNVEQSEQCPVMDVQVVGKKNMKCVYGVGFTNSKDKNSFGFMVSNSCNLVINITVDIGQSINENVVLDIWEYETDQYGNTAKYVDCMGDGNVWDESCAAIKPMYSQMNVDDSSNIVVSIQPISFILSVTK